MLCQQCKQRPATTHIKRVVNGHAEEFHLCPDCARESGLFEAGLMPELGLHLSDLFSGFLGSSVQQNLPMQQARCGFCGSSLPEIVKSGRVGCAQCYETFYPQLEPTLQRIHGSLEHTGKTPEDGNPDLRARREKEQTLADLRAKIAEAIKEENYEEAAKLRDEIRRAEEGGEQDA